MSTERLQFGPKKRITICYLPGGGGKEVRLEHNCDRGLKMLPEACVLGPHS